MSFKCEGGINDDAYIFTVLDVLMIYHQCQTKSMNDIFSKCWFSITFTHSKGFHSNNNYTVTTYIIRTLLQHVFKSISYMTGCAIKKNQQQGCLLLLPPKC